MIDARAHSLGAYKSSTFEDMQAFTEIALHITRESAMHVQVCPPFSHTAQTSAFPLPILLFTVSPHISTVYASSLLPSPNRISPCEC